MIRAYLTNYFYALGLALYVPATHLCTPPIESIACDLILELFKIVQVQKNVSCQRITDLAEKKLTYASDFLRS